jgi:hypothetical protein
MAVRLSALCTSHSLPPGRYVVLSSVRGWVDNRAIMPLEGLCQLKNPVTSSGIKPTTFQLIVHAKHNIWWYKNQTFMKTDATCCLLNNSNTLRFLKTENIYHITLNMRHTFYTFFPCWKKEVRLKFEECAPFWFFPKTHIQKLDPS